MNYSKWLIAVCGLCMAVALAGCDSVASSGPARENLLAGPLWDDGKAEYSTYTGQVHRYGKDRPAEVRIIVVKEDLFAASLVKSEAGPVAGKTVVAIKLNMIWDFPTGTYDYHQMATLMLRRDDQSVLKETMSSTEGCGITFVRVGPKGGRLVHDAHSYLEGEADREVTIATNGSPLLYMDAMPLTLRAYVRGAIRPFELAARVLPSQVGNRSPLSATRPVDVRIHFVQTETLVVPAGSFRAKRFAVSGAQGSDVYWFDAASPHTLLKMQSVSGRTIELTKTQRLDYWNYTKPVDEALLR